MESAAEQEAPAHVREGICVWKGLGRALYVHEGEVWYSFPKVLDEGCVHVRADEFHMWPPEVIESLALGLAEMHAWAHRGISACALEEENHAYDDEYQNWRTEHLTLALVLREMRSLFQREG